MKRIAGIATITGREESLLDTIRSLQNQVDEIHIVKDSEKGDWAKFDAYDYGSDNWYFSCDDDLIYPPDYCETMIRAQKKHEYPGVVIITCHGRKFSLPITNYYKNGIKYHCLHEVKQDVKVSCGGTGVMLLPKGLVLPNPQIINMADIHIAIMAMGAKIPIICMAHEAGWIKHTTKIDESKTIYNQSVNNCEEQTRLINTVQW